MVAALAAALALAVIVGHRRRTLLKMWLTSTPRPINALKTSRLLNASSPSRPRPSLHPSCLPPILPSLTFAVLARCYSCS
ncbi:hypothetical protein DFH06DRAFT_1232937 [Mycena polygramma]|nr:hypothetical protein DFH06DRAFT_1232937 [Mycena polygramma]